MASAEDLLALKPPTEAVELRGLKFNVRGLTAGERDDYEQNMVEVGPDGRSRVKAHQTNLRASLVVRCLVDDDGNRLFSDRDATKVGEVDGSVIDELWDVARRLSGMGNEQDLGFDSAQDGGNASA